MPLPSTYTPIATQTMTTATASVTFSNIPDTYTDLVLVVDGTTNSGRNFHVEINTTSTVYSFTALSGDGASPSSSRLSNEGVLRMAALWAAQGNIIMHFLNYSNTTTYKTVLSRTNNASNQVNASVGLWRSTAAINKLNFQLSGPDNFLTGTTFTIYGIKAA